MISFSDLLSPVTKNEATQTILDIGTALGLPVTAWQSGRIGRTIVGIMSTIYSGATQVLVKVSASGFLDTATDDWLDLKVTSDYGVVLPEATFATGFITYTNSGGGVYDLIPGEEHYTNTSTGYGYTNTYDAAIYGPLPGLKQLLAGASLTVPIAADIAGTASNATPGQITTLATPHLGVTITNADPVLGRDELTDDEKRALAKLSLGAASPNGPQDAYEYFARTATRADGAPVNVNRVRVVPDPTTGVVAVYLASPSGAAISGDVTVVDTRIQRYVTPLAITETTAAASEVTVPVTYTAWIDTASGLSSGDAQTAIAAALASYFETFKLGGLSKTTGGATKLWISKVKAIIEGAYPANPAAIFEVTLTAPAADVALAVNEVAVLGAITPTINLVAQ